MTVINVADLYKSLQGEYVLKGISFQVDVELVAISGPGGSGKTTLLGILSTNLKPDSGKVEILGFDVLKEPRLVRKMIAYLPEGYSAPPSLTPREYVFTYLLSRGFSYGEAREQTRDWLLELGLEDYMRTPIAELSPGLEKRVYFAAILASQAEVLLLDNPFSGVDKNTRELMISWLKKRVEMGITVVLTLRDLSQAQKLAQRVIVLDDGYILFQGPPRKLWEVLGPFYWKKKEAKD
ncbi:ABC transporter ATP-binding protein [Infirmifilum uzonense]|uniref:ABC transporter ATP-binding protein n=1 Tax=Infirmifilum uzonense TaxID=1550241 RepID=UPI003C76CBA8